MNLCKAIEILHLGNSKIYERPMYFNAEGEISSGSRPTYDSLVGLFTQIPERDLCEIIIIDNMDRNISFSNDSKPSNKVYNSFFNDFGDEEIGEIKIKIKKNISDVNIVSVYNYDLFAKFILGEEFLDSLKSFSSFLKERNYIEFEVFDRDIIFNTETICFRSPDKIIHGDGVDRINILRKSIDNVYFTNYSDIKLIPNDFLITTDFDGNPFSSFFDKCKTLLAIAYLSSIVSFDNKYLKGQIYGQRNIEICIDIDSLSTTTDDTLYRIYSWIFSEGNHVDKALIARNIISLHCRYSNIYELDGKTLVSIQANYNLYIKENVKDYIELKNKISEVMYETSNGISDRISNLLSSFVTNIVAVLGFIISVVLVNVTSANPLDNIFTKDIKVIFMYIFIGSIAYWLITIYETKRKSNHLLFNYDQLKNNYFGLLSKDDVDSIFDSDSLIKKAKLDLKKGLIRYSIIWVLLIIIGFILVITIPNKSVEPSGSSEFIKLIFLVYI